MIASGTAGKTTLRCMLTNQDAGAEKHYEVRDCFFSNRYTCCGEPFKKKSELETHLSKPADDGEEAPGVPKAGVVFRLIRRLLQVHSIFAVNV
jgi:hypothetical protein